MTRCACRLAVVGVAAIAVVGPALAQLQRQFPADALRGELTGVAPPDVLLNGKPARLAPGARIRNDENRFDVIGTLAGRRMTVNYRTEAGGQLVEIWILTATERANEPWPTTPAQAQSWSFDPVSQKWTRP